MAYNLGLGGAIPKAAYSPPATTPVLANGVYNIASNGRAACTNLLSAVSCNVDNTIQMANTGQNHVTLILSWHHLDICGINKRSHWLHLVCHML
jgi:hypothetical protein